MSEKIFQNSRRTAHAGRAIDASIRTTSAKHRPARENWRATLSRYFLTAAFSTWSFPDCVISSRSCFEALPFSMERVLERVDDFKIFGDKTHEVLSNVSLYSATKTPLSYRGRATVEFFLSSTSIFFTFCLCVFFIARPHLLYAFKPTIVFVTFGSVVLYVPFLVEHLYLLTSLWMDVEPSYSVLMCSLLKNFTSGMTSCVQVLPFSVSVYRYRTVVQNCKPASDFVFLLHSLITLLMIALLNFPLGDFVHNDQCETFRISKLMEIIRILFTLGLNVSAIAINLLIYLYVKRYEKQNIELQRRRVELTSSLLLQSFVPILVSLPLLLLSLEFYLGIKLPKGLCTRWYATTYFGPFLTPLSSMISLKRIRKEMLVCEPYKPPNITIKPRPRHCHTDSEYNSV
ncbi:unnamed protein product [Caenorhabditis auriculariae]|uniref:Uncharacterized protein n=1 Tax=Caenorhabditis auriculariae TaxID=2777116 RepID=A0A8S1GXU3_9PELO|nr:unnamed protein product [Caenorhabditis auriculariae]